MSLAVVGTDTGVGKTVVSALILLRHGAGRRIAYYKPVATGGRRDRDVAYVRSRAGERADVLEEEHLFDPPVSPHLAARWAGERIRLGGLARALERRRTEDRDRALLVEGVGGLLVPIDDGGALFADLIERAGLPAVLVARSGLGTINHTLLTLEAARARGIEVVGVVMNGEKNADNRDAIERFGRVPVIAEVPPLGRRFRPSREALQKAARRFDREGALCPHLAPEVVRRG